MEPADPSEFSPETLVMFGNMFLKGILPIVVFWFVWKFFWHLYACLTRAPALQIMDYHERSVQVDPYRNPFVCEVQCSTANSTGITCTLMSHVNCYVKAFWGVSVHEVFQFLQKDHQTLIEELITPSPTGLASKSVYANEMILIQRDSLENIRFEAINPYPEDYLSMQQQVNLRNIYPLSIMMVSTMQDYSSDFNVIAMVSAIHLPDNFSPLSAHMIGRFVKLSSGDVGEIKMLFLSSAADSNGGEGSGSNLCVICYTRPVKVVLLPCRHTCMCKTCFDLSDRCPMCRAPIATHFLLPENL